MGHGDNSNRNIPKEVEFFKEKFIIDIFCGSDHSIALTSKLFLKKENKKVYTWGNNGSNQLGVTTNQDYMNVPTEVSYFTNKKIIKISGGYNHSIAISENGNYYSWGDNTYGQLIVGDLLERIKPIESKLFLEKKLIQYYSSGLSSHGFIICEDFDD